MNKIIMAIVAVYLGIGSAYAASGIFGSGVVIENDGTLTLYEATLLGDGRHAPLGSSPTLDATGWGSTAVPTLNLGTFEQGVDTLTFKGGELLTWKDGGSNISGANVYYKIDAGSYSSAFSLGFNEDNVNGNGGDQRWYSEGSSIDLLSGLSVGTHTISVYFDAAHDGGTHFENNAAADFGASFDVIPEPATLGLFSIVGVLALFVRRTFMI